MMTFFSEQSFRRQATTELYGSTLVTPFETPRRMEIVLEAIERAGLGEVRAPNDYGLEPVKAVHDAGYIEFLANFWPAWQAEGRTGEAIPSIWPARTLRSDRIPRSLGGKLGYYALAAETSLCEGTFEAALASKDTALAALEHTFESGEPSFGLCRPPGHHAATDQFGGYCFFNNAAIAAQRALDRGYKRVAVLDVDFHHGNGTQQIFYRRSDVFFASLHGDPEVTFPYYLGYADETGEGEGEGFTANYPMAPKTPVSVWMQALEKALAQIARIECELLIVSLGVDIFEHDPISTFTFTRDDFTALGERLADAGLPTVFLMEGGYAVDDIGVNVVSVLQGFEARGGAKA
ncbi:histone deacetylase family protein [Vreelandella malpeensis]|uniref:Histone deacetylase family protein n=1 Tax=Vreelandella malpeensis TaxID=1172368 RepID=A0ABS8DQ04_9GAMM|nr:histone deacetylase family protein [Halomonas malpeensis]MCB8888376.1 histone deacetylase family protein [Halomonas malpeensis]